jgi:hypothetical protein
MGEIHPIVAFEAIYELMLTSFWSLISFVVQLYIIMQYKGQHPPLLPKMTFCLHPSSKNRMHFYSIKIRSSFLIQVSCMVYTIKTLEFKKLEWRFGCKICIVYTVKLWKKINILTPVLSEKRILNEAKKT